MMILDSGLLFWATLYRGKAILRSSFSQSTPLWLVAQKKI